MVLFKNQHINTEQNAEIAASAAQVFAQSNAVKEARAKYGSLNFFTIVNQSSYAVTLSLDGGDTRKFVLFANASITLSAEEGIFYDWLKVTNQDASNAIAAGLITITYGIAKPIM